ncbi:hypothetical protein JTB14_017724 [Gonioctena quinquepunctata]|nr:hypothetical protein JTB14_017724 [Gonioctena quinquepunctata]
METDVIFEKNILIREQLTTPTINGKNTSKIVTTNTDQNITSPLNFNSKCTLESNLDVHGNINGIDFSSWKNDYLRLFSNEDQDVAMEWNIGKNLSFSDDVLGNGSIGGMHLLDIAKEVEERRYYKYKFEKGIIDDYNNICTDVTYIYEKTKPQIYRFKYFENFQQLSFKNSIKHVFYFEHKDSHYLLVNENNCLSHMFIYKDTEFHPWAEHIQTGSIEQVVPVFNEDGVFLVVRSDSTEQKCSIGGTNIWKLTNNSLMLMLTMDEHILLQESLVPSTFYGINEEGVIEYRIEKDVGGYKKYRKWEIMEDNVAFIPRGLKTGLALRTGTKIIYLDQSDPVVEEDADENVEVIFKGKSTSVGNNFIPGKNGSDLVVLTVGMESARKSLLAVASHEETIIKSRSDFIKIYGDGMKGELFDKVQTYKPSSLLSIEFNQGETLLVFLEDGTLLQVYEYKGTEGFVHRTTVKIPGSKLFQMTLPIYPHLNPKKVVGIIYKNKIRLIQAVTDGNRIGDDLKCSL